MTAAVTSCLTFFSSSSSSSDVAARRVFAHCLFPYLSPGNLLIWAIIRVFPLVYSCFCRYSRWQSFISYFIVRRFCQRGSHNAVIKTGKGQNCSATFSWGYIQLMYNVSYYSNLSVIDTWELTVHCLFCNIYLLWNRARLDVLCYDATPVALWCSSMELYHSRELKH
jgi:hypothetical protein